MGVIHVTNLRESPGNQPRFERDDVSLLVCFIVETLLKAYRLTSLRYPVYHRKGYRFHVLSKPVPNPSDKQTVLPLLQCVGAPLLRWVSSRLVTKCLARVVLFDRHCEGTVRVLLLLGLFQQRTAPVELLGPLMLLLQALFQQ